MVDNIKWSHETGRGHSSRLAKIEIIWNNVICTKLAMSLFSELIFL